MSKKMLAEVKRIGTNGVSVELENGQRAWLPEYEITLDPEEDIDLEKEYPVGSKAWKRFAARAAHRMGARLADFAGGLTFLSEILTSEERQDETRELLEDMETAVYGMQAIIDQFKEFVNPREIH